MVFSFLEINRCKDGAKVGLFIKNKNAFYQWFLKNYWLNRIKDVFICV